MLGDRDGEGIMIILDIDGAELLLAEGLLDGEKIELFEEIFEGEALE